MHPLPFRLVLALYICVLSSAALAQATQPAATPPGKLIDPVEATADQRTRFAQPVNVSFDETPLDAIIAWCAETTGVPVEAQWSNLRELGIGPDHPITLEREQTSIEEVLDAALRQVSQVSKRDSAVMSHIVGRVVIDNSTDIAGHGVMLWLYDVHDLIEDQRLMLPLAHRERLKPPTFGGFVVDPPATQPCESNGLFCGNDEEEDDGYSRPQVQQYLSELIMDTTGDPTWWLDERATLTMLGNTLAVRATPDLHAEIRQLFRSLRDMEPSADVVKRDLFRAAIDGHLRKAEVLRQAERWDEAAAQTDTALRIDPDDKLARAMLELIRRSRPRE